MNNNKSVAIIGGGVSGLVCGGRLKQLGFEKVTVFDTGKHGPGGRASSRIINHDGKDFIFDHAVQYFTVSDKRFANIISFLYREKAVKIWDGYLATISYDSKHVPIQKQAFIGSDGIKTFCDRLSKLVNTICNVWVSKVEWIPVKHKWKVDNYGEYDYLVIAHNGKCAARLMSNTNTPQIHNILKVRFSPVVNHNIRQMHLCSLFVLCAIIPTSQIPQNNTICGAHIENPVISWIANNSSKYPLRNNITSVQCWTIISTKNFASKYKVPQEHIPQDFAKQITLQLLSQFGRILKCRSPGKLHPVKTKLQLWGAGNPVNILKGDDYSLVSSKHVGVCGDWYVAPSVEGAAVSGMCLAEALHRHYQGQRQDAGLNPVFEEYKGSDIGCFNTDPNLVMKSTLSS